MHRDDQILVAEFERIAGVPHNPFAWDVFGEVVGSNEWFGAVFSADLCVLWGVGAEVDGVDCGCGFGYFNGVGEEGLAC